MEVAELRGNGKAGAKRAGLFVNQAPAAFIAAARSSRNSAIVSSVRRGRPVGGPGALALSRLRREGITGAVPTAMAIRAGNWRWPLQTDVGTSWSFLLLATRRHNLAMAPIAAGSHECGITTSDHLSPPGGIRDCRLNRFPGDRWLPLVLNLGQS
jgi:hypothetical protein